MVCLRKGSGLVLTLIITLMSPKVWAEIVVEDALGDVIRLPQPARRIVSLAPHNTENLFAAGAGDALVGTMRHSDYPPEAKKIPRIGDHTGLDLEAIIALKPDLILAWQSGNRTGDIERLRSLGFAVFVSEPRRLDDVAEEIESLGRLAGTYPVAHQFAERFRKRLQRLRHRYTGASPVRIFYEIWHRPLMTINGEQLISQAITLCGGRNIFAHLPVLAATIDLEAVLAADPDAIITSAQDPGRDEQWRREWSRWSGLRAVTLNNLFFVPPDLLQRQGPRILDGVDRLCSVIATARRNLEHLSATKQEKPPTLESAGRRSHSFRETCSRYRRATASWSVIFHGNSNDCGCPKVSPIATEARRDANPSHRTDNR